MSHRLSPLRDFLLPWALAGWALLAQPLAQAQSPAWPAAQPIHLVVGYPAGGSVDMVARTVAEPLSKRLGTPVTVENLFGVGGTLGAQKVVNAPADGYTLLLGSGSEVSIARILNASVKYDGQIDLTPVGMIGDTPMVLVASPNAQVKTIDEALKRARKEPNKLFFASSGVGTPLHVSGELVNLMAGVTLRHAPYRGAPQMAQAVETGKIDFGVFVLSSALPLIQSGKVIALGVTTPTRWSGAPQIPSLAEHPKLKGYDMNVWFGLFGPAKLPTAIQTRLNKELNEVLKQPDVRSKLQEAGITTHEGTPQALAAFVHRETQRVRSVVNTALTTGAAP